MDRQEWIENYCEEFGQIYETVTYDNVERIRTVDVLRYGDYDTSCHVERANVKVMVEEFPNIPLVEAYYGAVTVNLSEEWVESLSEDDWERLQSILEVLKDYPEIDEAVSSQVEHELIQEAWLDYGRQDFKARLTRNLPDTIAALIYEVPDKAIDELWFSEALPGMHYFVESGGSVYFDVDKVGFILLNSGEVYSDVD